jgi:hypothetical protein
MSLSGGHWANLTEVLRLTQPTQLIGVVEEDVKRGNPVDILPFAQANHTGDNVTWLRELTTAEGDVADIGRGGVTSFTEGLTYTEKNTTLKTCYIQRKLDKFNPSIHGTFNDYENTLYEEMMSAVIKKLGNKILYDDASYGAGGLQMDGLHAIAAESYGENWDIDEGEGALSLMNLRTLEDEMRHGIDLFLIPFQLGRRIDAAYRENGVTALKADTAGALGMISYDRNEAGKRTMFFNGIPMIRSDFMLGEQANTGAGSNARAVNSSGTIQYSIFGIKLGDSQLSKANAGLKIAFGKTESDGEILNLEYFKQLENYIGKAMRLSANITAINGSKMCVGRIFDITNAAVTA